MELALTATGSNLPSLAIPQQLPVTNVHVIVIWSLCYHLACIMCHDCVIKVVIEIHAIHLQYFIKTIVDVSLISIKGSFTSQSSHSVSGRTFPA